MSESQRIKFLRISYWVGAIFDALVLIPLLSPRVGGIAFGIPNFNPVNDYAYGMNGPAPDVARLMIAYLNLGVLDSKRILRPESVATLTKTAPIYGHGLGWFIGESNGSRYLEHAGGGPSFATLMRLYPERELGIAILANGTDLDRQGLGDLSASLDW